ncbi:MAG: hypothetical protein IT435_01895 [Phycisphaerales bacterium]|nr:hypothetical protein [Phycisphaerales bacterium]
MPPPATRLRRLLHQVLNRWHYILAGSMLKWGSTAALLLYLRAHGMRPIWGIAAGLAIGAVVVVMALWPIPPISGDPPAA